MAGVFCRTSGEHTTNKQQYGPPKVETDRRWAASKPETALHKGAEIQTNAQSFQIRIFMFVYNRKKRRCASLYHFGLF